MFRKQAFLLALVFFLVNCRSVLASDYCTNTPILMYHHIQPLALAKEHGQSGLSVSPDYFDKQVSYLKSRGYKFLSLEQLVNSIYSQNVEPKSIALTFDDGYDDVFGYAYPIAKKYNVPINLMIASGLLNNKNYMSWAQLKEIKDDGLGFVYNHTWSHAALGKASLETLNFEINTSEKQLEENLGQISKIHAYPYGSYNKKVIDRIRELGFKAGITTNKGKRLCLSTVYTLPRIRMGNGNASNYGL